MPTDGGKPAAAPGLRMLSVVCGEGFGGGPRTWATGQQRVERSFWLNNKRADTQGQSGRNPASCEQCLPPGVPPAGGGDLYLVCQTLYRLFVLQ